MVIERVRKEAFHVLGKEGSTLDGKEFIQRLWMQANENFEQVAEFAVRKNGAPAACWGLMSSFDRSFHPWEDHFSQGLYLAGIECKADAAADGWVKWTVPAAEYIRILCEEGYPFSEGLSYLKENGIALAGAAFDHTDLISGRSYIYFPVHMER